VTEVELTGDSLIVHVQGMDQLWALRSRLEIPLAHVAGAEADSEIARQWWKGFRVGTHVPGVIAAGNFYKDGESVFWDVHAILWKPKRIMARTASGMRPRPQ